MAAQSAKVHRNSAVIFIDEGSGPEIGLDRLCSINKQVSCSLVCGIRTASDGKMDNLCNKPAPFSASPKILVRDRQTNFGGTVQSGLLEHFATNGRRELKCEL